MALLLNSPTVESARVEGPDMKTILNRELWLGGAIWCLARNAFEPAKYKVPTNVRVTCGFPSHGAMGHRRVTFGQAWDASCSTDDTYEICISPRIDDPHEVLATLAHELVHIVVGIKFGHRGPFRKCALAIGLEGPMTATKAGPPLRRIADEIIASLGPYPHGAMMPLRAKPGEPPPLHPDLYDGDAGLKPERKTTGKRPQIGRMRKVQCEECGMPLRVAAKWISDADLVCPNRKCGGHEYPMKII